MRVEPNQSLGTIGETNDRPATILDGFNSKICGSGSDGDPRRGHAGTLPILRVGIIEHSKKPFNITELRAPQQG
jgi:hypothetical protein